MYTKYLPPAFAAVILCITSSHTQAAETTLNPTANSFRLLCRTHNYGGGMTLADLQACSTGGWASAWDYLQNPTHDTPTDPYDSNGKFSCGSSSFTSSSTGAYYIFARCNPTYTPGSGFRAARTYVEFDITDLKGHMSNVQLRFTSTTTYPVLWYYPHAHSADARANGSSVILSACRTSRAPTGDYAYTKWTDASYLYNTATNMYNVTLSSIYDTWVSKGSNTSSGLTVDIPITYGGPNQDTDNTYSVILYWQPDLSNTMPAHPTDTNFPNPDGYDFVIPNLSQFNATVKLVYTYADTLPPDMDNDGDPDSTDPDIDGDGYSNEDEDTAHSDPENPDSTPNDIDGDGLDNDEDPDADGDGWTNIDEENAGHDPLDPTDTPEDEDHVKGDPGTTNIDDTGQGGFSIDEGDYGTTAGAWINRSKTWNPLTWNINGMKEGTLDLQIPYGASSPATVHLSTLGDQSTVFGRIATTLRNLIRPALVIVISVLFIMAIRRDLAK